MTYGTGPQALATYFEDNWQASRSGRNDIPAMAATLSGGEDQNAGVITRYDRETVDWNGSVHDLIHCYHPEGTGLDIADRGFKEHNVQEGVQIDIETTDRTDPSTGERLSARTRMVGNRDGTGFPADEKPPYPGIFGEVLYLLEEIRRSFEEWDVARVQPLTVLLKNSNASVSIDVQLEHLAKNTVQ